MTMPDSEPTPEEAHILERFDQDFFNLLEEYQHKFGYVRREVLRNAALSDVETWFDYDEETGDDDDETDAF